MTWRPKRGPMDGLAECVFVWTVLMLLMWVYSLLIRGRY